MVALARPSMREQELPINEYTKHESAVRILDRAPPKTVQETKERQHRAGTPLSFCKRKLSQTDDTRHHLLVERSTLGDRKSSGETFLLLHTTSMRADLSHTKEIHRRSFLSCIRTASFTMKERTARIRTPLIALRTYQARWAVSTLATELTRKISTPKLLKATGL